MEVDGEVCFCQKIKFMGFLVTIEKTQRDDIA